MNIRRKAIFLVLLLISLLASTFLVLTINNQRQNLKNQILAKQKNASFLTNNLQEQAFAHYRTRIISLATTKKKVIEAFAKRDRAALYEGMVGFYSILKHENPYFSNLQFNLPDGTSFLRMHLPDFHGDNLSTVRPILNHVHKVQQQATGYEVGRSGLFYRIVQPIFYQGAYIGTIGFGIKHDHLFKLLQEQISPHVALVSSASLWQKITHAQTMVIKHDKEVILPMGSELFSELPLTNSTLVEKRLNFKERNFVLFSITTLNDFNDQPIAKVLVALDISDDLKQLNLFIVKIILVSVVMLVLTALVLHFSFGQLLDTILQLNSSLTLANQDLEGRVEERTAELAKSNLALKKEMAERQHIEADLRQAEKMQAIGTLASGIAHDFNNILTAILGFTQLALLKLAPGEDIALHLEEVHKSGLRAKDLVGQILAFSRQSDQTKQALRLQPIIQEALKLVRASIPANITIVSHIDAACCPALVDPTQIHQVLMNLCTNASHAMLDRDGTLTIRLSEIEGKGDNTRQEPVSPPYLKLDVEDTGNGMEQGTLERIFEPYFTTKEIGSGTGIGLAVVHGIIKSYNGHITVKSRPGQGTAFSVLLPCCQEDAPQEKSLPSTEVVKGTGEHLLVVDDEKEILLYWEMLLKTIGYQVTTMTNGLTAYQWLLDHVNDIDAVITDMSMPKMTGLDLSKKIKDLAPSMPIALCSGFNTTELQEKAQAIGIKTFIKKPMDYALTSQALRDLLS